MRWLERVLMAWENQNIFCYFDGEQNRYGDPLEIHEVLVAHLDGDMNKVLANAAALKRVQRRLDDGEEVNPNEVAGAAACALAAKQKLMLAVVAAFGLKEFDPQTGEGATWQLCLAAFNSFIEWEETQKKNGEPERASSPPSEGSTHSNSPTPTLSGSGSTLNGRTGDSLVPSSVG